jgi:hypothetical protein
MQNPQKTDLAWQAELRKLVDFEVADIVATGTEQGYSAKEVLAALKASVAAASDALNEDLDQEKNAGSGPIDGSTPIDAKTGVE